MSWWEWIAAVGLIVFLVIIPSILLYVGRTPKGRPLTPAEIKWEQYKAIQEK